MERESAFRQLMHAIRASHARRPSGTRLARAMVFAALDMVDLSGGTGDPSLHMTQPDLVSELYRIAQDFTPQKEK